MAQRGLAGDLAGITFNAWAEERDLGTVFSLDEDFRVYRLARGKLFRVFP